MNISDHFEQAVSGSGTADLDLHRVARVARLQGGRARRRRGAAVLGSAAAVAALVVGSATLLGGGPGGSHGSALFADGAVSTPVATPTPTTPPTATPTPSPDLTATGRFTGRGVVAGLSYAVSSLAQGRAGAFAGQSDNEAYGQIDWTDADGRGVSVIGINVQPGFHFVSSCGPSSVLCTRTHPTAGSTLTTYEEHTAVAQGVGIRRVADLLRADGTRVVVSATNGYDLPSSKWDITRLQPPLDYAQLTKIVSMPWWDAQLPSYFVREGSTLAPYDDLDADQPTTEMLPTPDSP